MSFINDDFMLHSDAAKHLYNDFAKKMPIIDYHCHLSPAQIAENHRFENIGELFLGGDHYKWRLMRSNGVDEKYITGDADWYDKFVKFAETLCYCVGNPMFHWTHLELKRYFGIDEILTPKTAPDIWKCCNELLARDDFRARALIEKSNVVTLCTTDDPTDDLKYHKQLKEEEFAVKVLPTFRPDKAVDIEKDTFCEYIAKTGVASYDELKEYLRGRIAYFAENGCCLSDHSLGKVPFAEGDAAAVFEKKMNGGELSEHEIDVFKTDILAVCAKEYSRLGWAMQWHIGALRNNNSRMFEKIGADTGYDSINDLAVAENLSRLMDKLELRDCLPKTILYTLNPKDNYVLAAMLGNFQKAPTAGKIQFGSGWWFNDQRDGMEQQMKSLANLGLLGRFVGMLTDSRSFVSYPRHEYFRRVLCNLIGSWVENGEFPNDDELLKPIIEGICYKNAEEYFGF